MVRWVGAMPSSEPSCVQLIGLVGRHAFTISELPVNLRVEIGKCFTEVGVELSHASLVGRCSRLRRVIDEIVGKQWSKTSNEPWPCTSSALRRTTAFAVSDDEPAVIATTLDLFEGRFTSH